MQMELSKQEADFVNLLRRSDRFIITIIRHSTWRLEAGEIDGHAKDEGRGRSFAEAWDKLAVPRPFSHLKYSGGDNIRSGQI